MPFVENLNHRPVCVQTVYFFNVWKFRGGLFGSSGLLALSALFCPSGFVFLLPSGMWHHSCSTGNRIDDDDEEEEEEEEGSRLL